MTLLDMKYRNKKLVDNTEAFRSGKKELTTHFLFGDSGTGKSTSIKAIVNRVL